MPNRLKVDEVIELAVFLIKRFSIYLNVFQKKKKVSSSKRRPLPRGSLTFGASDTKLHFKPLSHQTFLQRLAPDLER